MQQTACNFTATAVSNCWATATYSLPVSHKWSVQNSVLHRDYQGHPSQLVWPQDGTKTDEHNQPTTSYWHNNKIKKLKKYTENMLQFFSKKFAKAAMGYYCPWYFSMQRRFKAMQGLQFNNCHISCDDWPLDWLASAALAMQNHLVLVNNINLTGMLWTMEREVTPTTVVSSGMHRRYHILNAPRYSWPIGTKWVLCMSPSKKKYFWRGLDPSTKFQSIPNQRHRFRLWLLSYYHLKPMVDNTSTINTLEF